MSDEVQHHTFKIAGTVPIPSPLSFIAGRLAPRASISIEVGAPPAARPPIVVQDRHYPPPQIVIRDRPCSPAAVVQVPEGQCGPQYLYPPVDQMPYPVAPPPLASAYPASMAPPVESTCPPTAQVAPDAPCPQDVAPAYVNPTFEHSEAMRAQSLLNWAARDGGNGLARFDAYRKFDPTMANWGHVLDRNDLRLGLESTDPRSPDHQMLQMLWNNYDVLKEESARLFGMHFDGVCLNDLKINRDYKARLDVPHADYSAPSYPPFQEAAPGYAQDIPPQSWNQPVPVEAQPQPAPVQPQQNEVPDPAQPQAPAVADAQPPAVRSDALVPSTAAIDPRQAADATAAPAPESMQNQQSSEVSPPAPAYAYPPPVRYAPRYQPQPYYAPREYAPPPMTYEQREAAQAQAVVSWASENGQNGLARFDANPKFDPTMALWGHVLDRRDLQLGLESTDPRSTDHRMLEFISNNYDTLKRESANLFGIHFDGVCLNDLKHHRDYIDRLAQASVYER
ncbi:MAG TPA: hypothetical protein V6C81_12255 [Planktothrix sp.]